MRGVERLDVLEQRDTPGTEAVEHLQRLFRGLLEIGAVGDAEHRRVDSPRRAATLRRGRRPRARPRTRSTRAVRPCRTTRPAELHRRWRFGRRTACSRPRRRTRRDGSPSRPSANPTRAGSGRRRRLRPSRWTSRRACVRGCAGCASGPARTARTRSTPSSRARRRRRLAVAIPPPPPDRRAPPTGRVDPAVVGRPSTWKMSFTPKTRPRNGPFGAVDIARSRRSARPGSGMSEQMGASASSRRTRSDTLFNRASPAACTALSSRRQHLRASPDVAAAAHHGATVRFHSRYKLILGRAIEPRAPHTHTFLREAPHPGMRQSRHPDSSRASCACGESRWRPCRTAVLADTRCAPIIDRRPARAVPAHGGPPAVTLSTATSGTKGFRPALQPIAQHKETRERQATDLHASRRLRSRRENTGAPLPHLRAQQ